MSNAPLVLIVDDVLDNRDMYSQYLAHLGFRVETAGNGEESIDRARVLKPDVIVMDLSLPVMDGYQATRRIKSDPSMRNIPVVALTGKVRPDSRRRATLAGCDVYLTKPCQPAELADEIRRLLARRSS